MNFRSKKSGWKELNMICFYYSNAAFKHKSRIVFIYAQIESWNFQVFHGNVIIFNFQELN